MLTGLIGTAIGPGVAFRWSLYILLSLWPVSIYLSARLFGIARWGAASSAAMSPFLVSAIGVGYEQKAYLWVGYGVWTQLWASLTLPLAWGLSWRAIREGRNFLLATVAVSLTIALHFETGYLAILPLLVWPLVARTSIIIRLRRAALLGFGVFLASAWVIVPLISQRTWAATNELLHGGPLVNGYGAERVLSWLGSGQLLDAGRLPLLTLFAGVGLALACVRWKADETGRALVVAFGACLLLSFGRTTFGVLVDAIPGSSDLFFRRFMMGVQLAAALFAGIGAAWCGRMAWDAREGAVARLRQRRFELLSGRFATGVVAIAAGVLLLVPAWSQLLAVDRHNATAIGRQSAADKSEGPQVDRLLAIVRRRGDGRVYAGMPSNWGMNFTVGAVPVFKYVESKDVDEVGYTLRTASLMTDPEYFFDERNPSDYLLFGIHYIILPSARTPLVPSRPITCAAIYCLWATNDAGYVRVGQIVGRFAADRSNVGARSVPLLHSALPQEGAYLRVALDHGTQITPIPNFRTPVAPGRRLRESSDLARGEAVTTVRMRRPGVAVLSASFDPGWTATVDGHRTAIFAVAPALVAAEVPRGVHKVVFQYVGFSDYPALFVLCGLSLATLAAVDLILRMRRTRSPTAHLGADSIGGERRNV